MNPDLSVVVPLFNEEDSVGPCTHAIVNAVAPLGVNFEIVFVDDGSRDGTVQSRMRLRTPIRACARQISPQLRTDPGDGGRHRAGRAAMSS